MIAAEMTPRICTGCIGTAELARVFFLRVLIDAKSWSSPSSAKSVETWPGRRKTCVRIAAPRHNSNNGHRHVNRTVSKLDAKVPSHMQEILYFFRSLPRTKNVRQLHIHGRDITRIDETLLCAWVAL